MLYTMTSNNQNAGSGLSFIQKLLLINAKDNTPSEWRGSIKTLVAAGLAIGGWIMLGALVWSQFDASRKSATAIETIAIAIKAPTSKDAQQLAMAQRTEQVAMIKDAQAIVNDTSNALYKIIGPITLAITGLYFVPLGTKETAESLSNKVGTAPPTPLALEGNDPLATTAAPPTPITPGGNTPLG
jgi:hypothetical protein